VPDTTINNGIGSRVQRPGGVGLPSTIRLRSCVLSLTAALGIRATRIALRTQRYLPWTCGIQVCVMLIIVIFASVDSHSEHRGRGNFFDYGFFSLNRASLP